MQTALKVAVAGTLPSSRPHFADAFVGERVNASCLRAGTLGKST